ncbi:NADH-quinone oxidoreductase subunit C [Streptoalloteichus hindustanus]|uniref:NADH-quinone oxidoreductase n=1 Tax=Streptoalloteichus hindustanus TaxID=2017 RepID=A0A1M4TMF4_STRHI|nr:NADH-quinone oxidoreductase subunit C [Streptoalloteichus hindustanus]SHE45663.1 NADH-quinone oxidoreductase subunit C [Streptoalloteichus hindustanus]
MTAGSQRLADRLVDLLPDLDARTAFGQTVVHVPVERWVEAATTARDELGCGAFDWLGAEDAGRPGSVGERHAVLLHVLAPASWDGLLLRTEVAAGAALPSVAGVWAGAAWHEREVAEMFGVALAGHPDPRRLLLPAEFAGHPLRKDFVLASRVVRPWPGRLEPGEDGTAAPSRRRLAPPGVPGPEWGPRRESE